MGRPIAVTQDVYPKYKRKESKKLCPKKQLFRNEKDGFLPDLKT